MSIYLVEGLDKITSSKYFISILGVYGNSIGFFTWIFNLLNYL